MTVAVLFARADSVYKTMPECDVYDIERDARTWPGATALVAHPPCRGWGRLRQFSHASDDERMLAVQAVQAVRLWGGVVEHPAESTLWTHLSLPRPGATPDAYGGYSVAIRQFDWGHRAEKKTWLYVVGCAPEDIPVAPRREGKATHCVRPTKTRPRLPSITKREREATPPDLARWLVDLAQRCAARVNGRRH